MRYFSTILTIVLLVVLTVFFSQCFLRSSSARSDPRGDAYAGAASCEGCHKDIVHSYVHNNHFSTSSVADAVQLKRMADSSPGLLYFGDSSCVRLEGNEKAFFQSSFAGGHKIRSEAFNIAFGSAEKAQTYAYWHEGKLYELPLTYFTSLNTWANSPGFPGTSANFGRVIESRCFECHASYVRKEVVQSGPLSVSEMLDSGSIVYGIDCERCHGPAARHVLFQQENPDVRTARYITPIKSLTRQQQLDVCAACHSGNDKSVRQTLFAFKPGDTLSHFYFPEFMSERSDPDVHGKQLQLLQSSLCFQRSDMTCISCHNTHEPEKNKIGAFISKCMDCHQNSAHAVNSLKESEQKKRDFNLVSLSCIDCHMPLQTSKTIYFNNGAESKNIPYFIRTHKIAIYK